MTVASKGHHVSSASSKQDGSGGLPGNFRRALEIGARVISGLDKDSDLEKEVERRRKEIGERMDAFDAVQLLGQLSMAESFIDPDTYSESEHPGSAYVVEMVTAELLRRSNRSGSKADTAIDANVLDPIRELAAEATLLESFRRQGNAGYWKGPEGAARGRTAARHLYLRNPGWWWQEHETLRGLFGEDDLAKRLREQLGFDCEAAIAISETIPGFVRRRVVEGMEAARGSPEEFAPGHPAYDWAEVVFDGKWKSDLTTSARVMPLLWAMNSAGDSCLLTAAEVAAEAGVEVGAATAYLDRFSLEFGQEEESWFVLAEAVRERPYVRVGDASYLPTVPGSDLWALRPAFEAELKEGSRYLKHRGRWLEQRASEILTPALEPDEIHESVHFGDGGSAESGEIDVLMRCGETAMVVEAKSATLRPGAKRGGEALLKHLRQNLTKAAAQGEGAKKALVNSAALRSADGEPIILGAPIREVQAIVVTLDDLSSVAPVLWELQGTKSMPEGVTAPWVVTVHELEQVAATTRWPVQMIHFLRRRSRLNEIGGKLASDELDWWMHYLNFGLYFDEEKEKLIRFTSLTDPLDQWFLFEQGVRSKPAPKPEMNVPKGTEDFLDLLCSERPDAWVRVACALLDVGGKAQAEYWKAIKKLRKRARQRDCVQRCALTFIEPEPLMLCAVAVTIKDKVRILDALTGQVADRFEDYGGQRTMGIGTLTASKRPYDALVLLEPADTSKESRSATPRGIPD